MITTDKQDEILTQVDLQNKVIGPIERGIAHNSHNLIYRTVYILIRNDKDEILIQKRSPTKDLYPNCWDLSVGGHVIYGDSYEQTAVRELEEELGIYTMSDELLLKGQVLVVLPNSREFFNVYEYKLKESDLIISEANEVVETRWVSLASLKESMESKTLEWYERPIQTIQALY